MFFGFLQHFPPDDFYDTVAYRTFLRVAVGFCFLHWCTNQVHQQSCRKWNWRFDRTCLKSVRTFVQLQQMFCQSNTVYILLHAVVISGLNIRLSSTEHYIGSTIHTLHDRQNTRQRKLRQLKRAQPVSCKLALHWFCSQNNYHQFVALPLLPTNTTLQTRTLESYIIQKWCPPLNYPFILQRQVTKQHSTPHLRQALRTTYLGIGHRLYAQLRRRLMCNTQASQNTQASAPFYQHSLRLHNNMIQPDTLYHTQCNHSVPLQLSDSLLLQLHNNNHNNLWDTPSHSQHKHHLPTLRLHNLYAFNTQHHSTAMPCLQPPPHYNAAIPNLQLSPPQYGSFVTYQSTPQSTSTTLVQPVPATPFSQQFPTTTASTPPLSHNKHSRTRSRTTRKKHRSTTRRRRRHRSTNRHCFFGILADWFFGQAGDLILYLIYSLQTTSLIRSVSTPKKFGLFVIWFSTYGTDQQR